MASRWVKERLLVGLDDLRALGGTAKERFRGLVYGVAEVRSEALLWQYLRARGYARQAAAVVATTAVSQFAEDEELVKAVLARLSEAGEPLASALESEPAFGAHVFEPQWAVAALCSQMLERDVPARLRGLVRPFEEGPPLARPFLTEDTLSEIREVVRLRNECRAVSLELIDVITHLQTRADARPIAEIAGWARSADEELASTVKSQPEPRRAAAELKSRFYEIQDVDDSRVDAVLAKLGGSRRLLRSSDLPWLSGQSDTDLGQREEWWV
jgi:hypothetical protein